MKKNVLAMVLATLICAVGGTFLKAAVEFLESAYRSDTIVCTNLVTTFTIAYTNTTGSKVALASVFVGSSVATNSWVIKLVNNSQSQVLVNPTALDYTAGTTTLKYDGTGNVPLGAGGVVQVTGDLKTNAAATVVLHVHMR